MHKSAVLKSRCDEIGRDYDEIVRSSNFFIICEETENAVEDRIAWVKDRLKQFMPEEQAERSGEAFRAMSETPEQLAEKLRPWVDAGCSYVISYFPEAAADTGGLERFAAEVIPDLT